MKVRGQLTFGSGFSSPTFYVPEIELTLFGKHLYPIGLIQNYLTHTHIYIYVLYIYLKDGTVNSLGSSCSSWKLY